jgi:hypothetical protein
VTIIAGLLPRLIRRTAEKAAPASPHGDFRPLVGGGGWASLPQAVQDRFDALGHDATTTTYSGTMTVNRSALGWVFAQICRLFGNPLVQHQGDDVPVDVNVFSVPSGGICWQRVYSFAGRKPLTVQSVKIVDVRRGLLECIGGGLGMRLKVFERDQTLHFTSRNYFVQLGRVHLPIPLWVTPGRLHVEHVDEGGGKFRFRLSFTHPWFGVSFFQDGIFKEKESR